jgi:hypothetical protein
MGLYLCIFDEDEEIDGVEVGQYADFNALRDYIVRELEGGQLGSRFPALVMHSDCDGEWTPSECMVLRTELSTIISEMKSRPVIPFSSDWQKKIAKFVGLVPTSAFESFIDADGEFVLDRMMTLANRSVERNLPILFQ